MADDRCWESTAGWRRRVVVRACSRQTVPEPTSAATADQFRFIYQTLDGDGEVIARVDSLERTSPWAKAGLMIRDELTAGAKHASALITPNKAALFLRRIANDATTSQTAVQVSDTPMWLKIVRKGNAFTAYRSANGTSWTQMGSEVVYLKRLAYVGTGGDEPIRARALRRRRFSNVKLTRVASTPNQSPTVSLTAPATGRRNRAGDHERQRIGKRHATERSPRSSSMPAAR